MSYYSSGGHPPSQQGYYDQYGQYQQGPPPGQNGGGGYAAPYGQQPAYPGQQTYDQYAPGGGGGPVQQPAGGYAGQQEGYVSPRAASFGQAAYAQQQQQGYSYNPQHYAQSPQLPQHPQPGVATYNPAAYASPHQQQAPYAQQSYNSPTAASYSEQPASASTSGPLGANPYGYSPGTYSTATVSPQQGYQPSPPQPQYSPQLPSHQYSYAPPVPPQRQQTYSFTPPAAEYPGQPGYGRPHAQSVGAAMQVPASSHNYQVSPALPGLSDEQTQTWLPSPPQYNMNQQPSPQHPDTRQSPSPLYHSTSNTSLPSPQSSATPGPTPPAHGSFSTAPGVSRSNTLDQNQRTGSLRHPGGRPLPGPPALDAEPDYFSGARNGSRGHQQMTQEEAEALTQEELFNQVEDAVLNAGSGSVRGRGHSPSISVSQAPYPDDMAAPAGLFASSGQSPTMTRNGSIVNGHLSPHAEQSAQLSGGGGGVAQYSDESDAEAAQGLAWMQAADEEDARRQSGGSQMRFSSGGGGGSLRQSRQQTLHPHGGSDSDDFGGYDVSAFEGPQVQMSYGGNDPSALLTTHGSQSQRSHGRGSVVSMPDPYGNGTADYTPPVSSQHSSMRRSHASQSSQISRDGRDERYDYGMDSIHPFPPFNPAARVDAHGTGGLAEPGLARRQSYDEGDEYALMDAAGGTPLPERFPDEPLEMPFMQATSSNLGVYPSHSVRSGRPLPAVPGHQEQDELSLRLNTDAPGGRVPAAGGAWPNAPNDGFGYAAAAAAAAAAGPWGQRTTSLISHSTTPLPVQPLRSKTDAEERKLKGLRGSVYGTQESGTPSSTSVGGVGLPDLPSLGAKRFVPSALGAPAFKKCAEPWALSGVLAWLLQVIAPEQYSELRETEVKEALVALFTSKVPTMNIADAEGLSARVVADMYQAGTLVTTEEWVKLVEKPMGGVIFQLTGAGCYAPTIHDHIVPGRCYAHHCQRTLKKVNLSTQPLRTEESWVDFYHLTKEDLEGKDRKELDRQNVLHEIVQTEDMYMEQLNVLRTLYRDTLVTSDPSVITPKRRDKFVKDVFGRVDAVKQANEDHLLPQLKYRQQEQGPWIVGFSDIFRQWIRKAKSAYLEYAANFPTANFLFRQELDRNMEFLRFVERASKDKRSQRLQWDTFLKAPITRLQRYTLLLQTVIKSMRGDHLEEEKRNLQVAFDEVKNVTLECDARVAEMQRKVDLTDLAVKLVLRPGMQHAVELNLDHMGRQLIHRGDLQRMGGNRFTWLDSHGLLFDHYLVIAKTVAQRSDQGGTVQKYDVSRLPIPMDLLILESTNDPPVQKSSYVRGITSVSTVSTGRSGTPAEPGTLGRTATNQSPGPNGLAHTNTSTSLQTVSSLGDRDAERIMYPFKIKHLGREVYTLFAPNESARTEWCTKIIEAKTKHAAALYAQHAEPFRLRVMADSAFVMDALAAGGNRSVVIKGTPVDRAIKEVEQRFKDTGRPGPICRARVNCATAFTKEGYAGGKTMVAVGTDFGVFLSEMDNPRGWKKSIPMSKVTQIAVLEEFNLFLLVSSGSLIAYHLDVICSDEGNGPTPSNDAGRKAPQKLSGSRDVGFFLHGKMKDRTLVFYKKRDGLNSVFKVLEPIYQKSTERRNRMGGGMFRRGNTEFFREYDEFYIPAECSGMNLFHSSLAVSTAKGFEVLTLERKQPWSVPNLHPPEVQNIKSHVQDQRALSMLRLSEQEFLLCYSNCAVYVNKHGEVSRSVIMDFVGNAQSAALYGPYLVLFDADFVEIRNAQNGRLKQIIAGREIKCLDDGGSSAASAGAGGANGVLVNGPGVPGGRTVKLVMQHPELERTQIVVELLLNENMKE